LLEAEQLSQFKGDGIPWQQAMEKVVLRRVAW